MSYSHSPSTISAASSYSHAQNASVSNAGTSASDSDGVASESVALLSLFATTAAAYHASTSSSDASDSHFTKSSDPNSGYSPKSFPDNVMSSSVWSGISSFVLDALDALMSLFKSPSSGLPSSSTFSSSSVLSSASDLVAFLATSSSTSSSGS